PDGWMSASTGMPAPSRASSASGRATPTRPAMAARWMTALVEPPTACSTRMALPKAAGDSSAEGARPPVTAATARRPASAAAAGARGSPAGIVLDPGTITPSASVSSAIVEAAPIVLQAPAPPFRHASSPPPPPPPFGAGPAGAAPVREPPQRGGGPDPLAPEDGSRAGAAGDHHGGDVRAGGAHDGARHRLVTVGEDDDPVQRVGPDHLLDLDR